MSKMMFELVFTEQASSQLDALGEANSKKVPFKAVLKTLGLMETNLRHPSLNTHEYSSLEGADGERVLESYAQNKTPGAYRIFWHYGPQKGMITVVAIVPHPK